MYHNPRTIMKGPIAKETQACDSKEYKVLVLLTDPDPILRFPSLIANMPVDLSGKFRVSGAYHGRTISYMTGSHYSCTCTSPHSNPVPYPTCDEMMVRMDAEGEGWYSSVGEDLYLKDFIFQAWMQTARYAAQRWECFPCRDRVLDRLIEEGTFDHQSPDTPNAREELAMSHAAAMVQRLLMRIECLEADVST